MKKNRIKKAIALGTVLLFIIGAFTPAISSFGTKKDNLFSTYAVSNMMKPLPSDEPFLSDRLKLIGNATSIGTKWAQENQATILTAYNTYVSAKDPNKLISFASLVKNISTSLNCSHWIEECNAIADFLGVNKDFFIAFQFGRYRGLVDGFNNTDPSVFELNENEFHECKSFVCYPPATRDDQIIFHKTRDNFAEPQAAYIKHTTGLPSGQGVYKFFGTMGCSDIGISFFINEKGLAGSCDMGGTASPAKYNGLMNHMTLRYFAERCQNVSEVSSALHYLVENNYTAGAAIISNYLFIDAEGNALHIADNGWNVTIEELNPSLSYSGQSYPGIWSTVSITPLSTLVAHYGDIDVQLVDSTEVGKNPDVSGGSSSISGGTFLIDPTNPETLNSIFISLPAKAYSVPILMGATETPKALMNGTVYTYQLDTFESMDEIFENEIYSEWKNFYNDIASMMPGQNVTELCNENFSYFVNRILNPGPLNQFPSGYQLVNVTQTASFTHLNLTSTHPYDSLVLYMPFDTNTSITKVYDYSASKNHGTYYFDATTDLTFGRYGGSLFLDGVQDYVALSKLDTVGGASAVTFSAWVYVVNDGTRRQIFDETFSGGTTSRISLDIMQDNTIRLGGRSQASENFQFVRSVAAIPLEQWVHLVGIMNVSADTAAIYVNGASVDTTGTPAFGLSSFSPTLPQYQNIGKPAGIAGWFNGWIDECMIFNTSLTSPQLTSLYQGQSARFVESGQQNFNPFNVSFGSNLINVSTAFQNLQGTNLSLKIGFYNGSWHFTENQIVTGSNTYMFSDDSTMLTLNYTFSANGYQFYSPVWLDTSVSIQMMDRTFTYLVNETSTTEYGYLDGTRNNTVYNYSRSALQLNQSQTQGLFVSQMFDVNEISQWKTISWRSDAIGELADNQLAEDRFVSGNVNMSGNVLLMHMNEQSGPTVFDSSGKGNHGASLGVTYGVPGQLGTAIGFDGVNDNVTLGVNAVAPDLNGAQGITISTWINPASLATASNRNNIVDILVDADKSAMMLALRSGGRIWFGGRSRAADTTFLNIETDTALAQVNTWQHIAGVLDFPNDKITLYYNGQKVKEGSVNFGSDFFVPGTPTATDVIGCNPPLLTHWFHGAMDEFSVWGRRLSQQEIVDVYQRGIIELDFSVRGGDQEDWVDIDDDSPQNLSIPDSKFFQYRVNFSTADLLFSPSLYDVTVNYMKLNQPPYTPSNPNPANGATNIPITATLSWTGGDPDPGDTVTYDIYFGTTSPPPKIISNQSTLTYTPAGMTYNTQYYWKIIAWDNHGASTTGPTWSFTTTTQPNQPPYTPSNPNPANGATNIPITATLSWTGGDPDPGDTVTYDIYFGTTSPPPKIISNQSTLTYTPAGMTYNTQYYWKIIAWDNHKSSNISPIWSFTTEADTIPPTLKITSPQVGYLYINLLNIFVKKTRIFFTTFIVGRLEVTATAIDEQTGINRVEFYIDDKLIATDKTEPYSWTWTDRGNLFQYRLGVAAYDNEENRSYQEIRVWKVL